MLDTPSLSGLSSGAPLPRDMIYAVSDPVEEEDDIADPFAVFEIRRKALVSAHLNAVPPLVLIRLKSERHHPPDPQLIKNPDYRPRSSPTQDVEFEFTRHWIDAVSMDLDDDYPIDFLAQLPDAPQAPLPRPRRRAASGQPQDEDPVEQAFQVALAEAEVRAQSKEPSAEQLTREWGFEDRKIARTLKRVMHRK
jgi:hypothetical protein